MSVLSTISLPPQTFAGTGPASTATHGGTAFSAVILVANDELTTQEQAAHTGTATGLDTTDGASIPGAFADTRLPFRLYDERFLAIDQPLRVPTESDAITPTPPTDGEATPDSTPVPAPVSTPDSTSEPRATVVQEPEVPFVLGTAKETTAVVPPALAAGSLLAASPEHRDAPVRPLPTPLRSAPSAPVEQRSGSAAPPAESAPKLDALLHGLGEAAATTVIAEIEEVPRQASSFSNNPSGSTIAAAPAPSPTATAIGSTPVPTAAAPAAQPPLAAQLARPVFALATAGDGEHTLTISVNPERLGPVTVHATVSGDRLHIELFSSSDLGRDALRSVLGELRRDLAGTGLHASVGLSTDDAPPKQSHAHSSLGQSGSQQHRSSDDSEGPVGTDGDRPESKPSTNENARHGFTEPTTTDPGSSLGSGSPVLPTLDLIT